MMANSSFLFSRDLYVEEFTRVGKFLVYSYNQMVKKHHFLHSNYETYIRNVFVKQYLRDKKAKVKFDVGYLLFEVESGEIDINNNTVGFIDIKVLNLGSNDLTDEDEYYSIECKRLDGSKTKNRLYIDEGIRRYTLSKYSSQMPFAAMIGFVEKGTSQQIVQDINYLLAEKTDLITFSLLNHHQFEDTFNESYKSEHKRINSNYDQIVLYHLMFDVKSII